MRGRRDKVMSTIDMPENGDLLESVLEHRLREVFRSPQLVNMMLLLRRSIGRQCQTHSEYTSDGIYSVCWPHIKE